MLLLISRMVNGGTPAQGEGWNRRLLERMAMATDTRPAVLNEATQVELQEYLRFRHLVRNLYADELRVEPIQRLIEQLQSTWPKLEADIKERLSKLADIDRFREHLIQGRIVFTSPQRPFHRRRWPIPTVQLQSLSRTDGCHGSPAPRCGHCRGG